jgi:hypothetical protein
MTRKEALYQIVLSKVVTPQQKKLLESTGKKATNFDIRISKKETIDLLRLGVNDIIMCKEYGDDDDWVALAPEEADMVEEDRGTYKTFELWIS